MRGTPSTVTVAPESDKDSDWGSVPFTNTEQIGESEENAFVSTSQPTVVAASDGLCARIHFDINIDCVHG